MASLLTDPLFETSGRGPPPIKDYYHFFVTKSEIIWRWWKISPRMVDRHSKPGEVKESLSDFLEDTDLQREEKNYVKHLVKAAKKMIVTNTEGYVTRLKDLLHSACHTLHGELELLPSGKALRAKREVRVVFGDHVLEFTMALCEGHYNYLDRLSDSLLLRIINFLELEDVDQLAQTSRKFQQLCGSEEFWEKAMRRRCCSISDEVASLAKEIGWRTVFFTSKLHLQRLLSRRRHSARQQQEGTGTEEVTESRESSTESFEEMISGAEADLDSDHIEPQVDNTEVQVDNTEAQVDNIDPHIDNVSNHNDTSGSEVGV